MRLYHKMQDCIVRSEAGLPSAACRRLAGGGTYAKRDCFALPLNVLFYDLARKRGSVRPHFPAGIEGGVDAGMDVVAEDGAEFLAAGVEHLAFDDGADVG